MDRYYGKRLVLSRRAATKIQAAWRGYLCRRHFTVILDRQLLARRNAAASKIALWVLGRWGVWVVHRVVAMTSVECASVGACVRFCVRLCADGL